MFSQYIINLLIELGKSDDHTSTNIIIDSLSNELDFNTMTKLEWKYYYEKLQTKSDIIYLYKGLILVESEFDLLGSSVSPCIYLYKLINSENLDPNYELADWALVNTKNPYVPFGTWNYSLKSTSDYFLFMSNKAKESQSRQEQYNKVLLRVSERKIKRKNAIAALRKLSFEERSVIKDQLLKKYENLSTIQKLEIIAKDTVYPPEYYPIDWIRLSDEDIALLPNYLIKDLYDKLSSSTKGQWKRFAIQLSKYDDGI
jgi:hypothetical protein